jgi:hypothetical protein
MIIKNERGQTLILMLIVTVVSLTIGVAISSRAVSTLKQTSYTAQAGKAQKFADAGAEHALPDPGSLLGCTSSTPCKLDVDNDGDDNDVSYYVEQSGGGTAPITFTSDQDETYEINLTSSNLTQVRISWNGDAIITYSVIKKDGATGDVSTAQRGASDPDESGADGCNLPLGSSDPVVSAGSGYDHKIDAAGLSVDPAAGDDLRIRIRPLCGDADIQVEGLNSGGGPEDLPNQGYKITSTGTYGEAEWTAEVTKMNPALPAIFDYAIFSDTSLTK